MVLRVVVPPKASTVAAAFAVRVAWVPWLMVNAWLTCVAAAYVVLPLWFAAIVQLPEDSKVTLVPETEQTVDIEGTVENVTVSPDVAVAVNVAGPAP